MPAGGASVRVAVLALLHMTLPPEEPKSASEATVWSPTTQKTPPLAISKDVVLGKTPYPATLPALERAGVDQRRAGVAVAAGEAEPLAGAHLPDAAAAADVVRERGDSRRAIEGQEAVIDDAAGAVDRSGAAGAPLPNCRVPPLIVVGPL